ncbi:hypothetical protein BGX27_003415 [Mortierella sp. AM989]|nr:hypothetical protein BGX27_003415 [Mortierella sp. AM989]
MAVMFGSMQLTNRLDLEDTKTKRLIFGIYMTSQVIVLGISLLIHRRIRAKKDTTSFTYIEQPKPLSGEKPKKVTTTVMKYDLEQSSQARNQIFFSLAIMLVMHFKFGVVRPLVIQSIMPLKSAFESKWAQIHLLGKPAKGDLERPWKVDNPFSQLSEIAEGFKNEFGNKDAAIKEGERAGDKAEKPKVESKKDL